MLWQTVRRTIHILTYTHTCIHIHICMLSSRHISTYVCVYVCKCGCHRRRQARRACRWCCCLHSGPHAIVFKCKRKLDILKKYSCANVFSYRIVDTRIHTHTHTRDIHTHTHMHTCCVHIHLLFSRKNLFIFIFKYVKCIDIK